MTPIEATDLAVRLGQTWPRSGIAMPVWEEELVELDRGRATTAFVRLRRVLRTAPSIAEFLTEYRAVDITDGGTRRQHGDCAKCTNTGVIPVAPEHPDGIEQTRGVRPCDCPFGDERRPSLERIIARNAAELDRVLPGRHQLGPLVTAGAAAPATDPLF